MYWSIFYYRRSHLVVNSQHTRPGGTVNIHAKPWITVTREILIRRPPLRQFLHGQCFNAFSGSGGPVDGPTICSTVNSSLCDGVHSQLLSRSMYTT